MTKLVFGLCTILFLFLSKESGITQAAKDAIFNVQQSTLVPVDSSSINSSDLIETGITAAKALDAVKAEYAANFEKVYKKQSSTEEAADLSKEAGIPEESNVSTDKDIYESTDYYYKLQDAEFYLAFEGLSENGEEYLIHLYEFVTEDTETGIGHFITYGWYTVNKNTGRIQEQTQ